MNGNLIFRTINDASKKKTKDDQRKGEDLLRRIGSVPSYEQIISKYKEERDLTRHAGAGKRREKIDENVEINGEEIDIEEAVFTIEGDDLNTSVELQEVEREFDLHSPHAPPQEISTSWSPALTGSSSRALPSCSASMATHSSCCLMILASISRKQLLISSFVKSKAGHSSILSM